MSMISEQVKELRNYERIFKGDRIDGNLSPIFGNAADNIEALSAKMASENMERSDRYYGNETNLKKFKEWIANSNIEQIAEYLLHEYDGILYTSDGTDFDDTKKLEAINHEIEWLNAKYDEEYWNMW